MANSKREYNDFIRANLPFGITYDSTRFRYVTHNGKRFVTYSEAKWYIDYIAKFGQIKELSREPGLIALWDASVLSDGAVAYWPDSTGNFDLTAVTAPTKSDGRVTFTGETDKFALTAPGVGAIDSDTDFDLFWLGTPTADNLDTIFKFGQPEGGTKLRPSAGLYINGDTSNLRVYKNSAGNGDFLETVFTSEQTVLIYARFRGTTLDIFIDGAATATATKTLNANATGAFAPSQDAEVGGSVLNSNRYFIGDWYSGGLVMGALADRQKIEGFVCHIHGQTALLPVDHPYKTDPPLAATGANAVYVGDQPILFNGQNYEVAA